jgi:Ca2+-binding RTX toxin-like protein
MGRWVLVMVVLGTGLAGCVAEMSTELAEIEEVPSEAELVPLDLTGPGADADPEPEIDVPEDPELADEDEAMVIELERLEVEAGAAEEALVPDGAARAALGRPSGIGRIGDPCDETPTIRGTEGNDRIEGTRGRDVIYGLGGDDVILGHGGNDIICSGFGQDVVFGGSGDDYLDLGAGKDRAKGGPGSDTIHGRAGGDRIHGGPGADFIYGDILDDHLYGDAGADLLVGGHGVDTMRGGSGNDWLRGDTNADVFVGGSGRDTASFMTAMPPGQPLPGQPVAQDGIAIRMSARSASGDGFDETVRGIETVIGSAFDDRMWGGTGVRFEGGPGDDRCNDTACDEAEGPVARTTPIAFVDPRPRDTGLIVLGAPGDVADDLEIQRRPGGIRVVSRSGPIAAGSGCHVDAADPGVALCSVRDPLRYLMAWGGDGDDSIAVRGSDHFPGDFTAHLGGGPGNDVLRGGSGQDVLFGGITGSDHLAGGAGDDALISESPPGPNPRGEAYTGGGDIMQGGHGNDQLVADYPCGAHHFIGDDGWDIAGFARVGTEFATARERSEMAIHATLGGHAWQPFFCARMPWATRIDNDLEILEGAGGNDELHGNSRDNFIWGWGGDDSLHGHGGNDILEGMKGTDRIFGGPGMDLEDR